jgi:uncharacterized protein (DUF305 family)
MRRFVLLAALATLGAAAAVAQEHQHGDAGTAAADPAVLPPVCEEALKAAGSAPMMPGMDMAAMDHGSMDEAQQASLDAMVKMTAPMMATHAIKDPDLAFNCGMIAHHQGAIDMAQAILQHGKDESTKQMAQRIIDAQRAEIQEMTARAERLAAQ